MVEDGQFELFQGLCSGREVAAGELANENFEEFVDGSESVGHQEQRSENTGGYERSGAKAMARWLRVGWLNGGGVEQAIDASGKIAVAGEKRRGEKRKARAGAHAGDVNQRGG